MNLTFWFFSKLQKSCLEIIISILEYFCMYVSQTSIILLFSVTLIIGKFMFVTIPTSNMAYSI